MNANNINQEKLYLISFGSSDKYVLRDTEVGEKSSMTQIEAELNAFLRKHFPNETFTYYTTPRVEEISQADESEYASYRALDSQAIEEIKKVLVEEVKNMEANSELNDDAPFANVNPAAADIPHILG